MGSHSKAVQHTPEAYFLSSLQACTYLRDAASGSLMQASAFSSFQLITFLNKTIQ